MINTKTFLNDEHARFAQMIQNQPIRHFWDWNNVTCRVEDAKKAMKSLSRGEQMMAEFFIALWVGDNELSFDFMTAARRLDQKNRDIIIDWLEKPFWP
jgi:hypothetical protein